MEEHPILSENEKLAMHVAGDTTTRVMTLDGRTAQDIIEERNVKKFNEQVDKYVEKLNEHAQNLDNYAKDLADNIEKIEIMPFGSMIMVKEFAENPFQRIVRKGNIIVDLGGQRPQYKNTDNGEIEEEENIIKVAAVQEVGPDCKWIKRGDVVFYVKNSEVPIPFYKQGLVVLFENRVLAVVNEGLSKRFNKE